MNSCEEISLLVSNFSIFYFISLIQLIVCWFCFSMLCSCTKLMQSEGFVISYLCVIVVSTLLCCIFSNILCLQVANVIHLFGIMITKTQVKSPPRSYE